MISELLQQAREYEKKESVKVPDVQRPEYHVTAPIGWINDPNGFSVYKGWYHLFYQYHPYSTHWGPMHWGHVRTKDFIKWEQLPTAIAPDTEYDQNGCFSGSALEMPDGRQLLMYTSVVRREDEDGEVRDYQQQAVAFGDGTDYVKDEHNPVIPTAMIPEGGDIHDFRDPKVFMEGDNYYVLVGNRSADNSGQLLLYSSKDCVNWEFKTIVDKCSNEYGKMWECPDYFDLEGKQILIVSPQEMQSDGGEFHPGNGTVLFVGNRNADFSFERESVQTLDFGTDFYAPQTLITDDGRRVMIAWMQNWDTCNYANHTRKIYGQMTVPRELFIRDGRVCQKPVRELENYYGKKVSHKGAVIEGKTELAGIKGRVADLNIHLDLNANDNLTWFRVDICRNDKYTTYILFDATRNVVIFNRAKSGIYQDIITSREFEVQPYDGQLDMRILLDKCSVELFINGGEKTVSSVIYTPLEADEISFAADTKAVVDIEMAELKF